MKTTAFFISFLAIISLSSCKKNYTCECVKTSPSGSTTETHDTGKMSLDDARNKCNDGDESRTVLGETYTTECSLK